MSSVEEPLGRDVGQASERSLLKVSSGELSQSRTIPGVLVTLSSGLLLLEGNAAPENPSDKEPVVNTGRGWHCGL